MLIQHPCAASAGADVGARGAAMAQPVERKLQFSIYSCSGEVRRPWAPAHTRAPARPAHAITPAAACTADVRGRLSAQDPAYPAAELLRSGADARGWQSPKCAARPLSCVSAVARPGGRTGAALRRAGPPGPGARASRWSWRWRSRSRRTWSACRSSRTSSRCAAVSARRAAPPRSARPGRILRTSFGQRPMRALACGCCGGSPAAGPRGARPRRRPLAEQHICPPCHAQPPPLHWPSLRPRSLAPRRSPNAWSSSLAWCPRAAATRTGSAWAALAWTPTSAAATRCGRARPSPTRARRLPGSVCSIPCFFVHSAVPSTPAPSAPRSRPLQALAGPTRTTGAFPAPPAGHAPRPSRAPA